MKHLNFLISFFILVIFVSCSINKQQSFESPESLMAEMKDVVATRDKARGLKLLGPDADFFFETGDENLDRVRSDQFVQKFTQKHYLELQPDGSFLLRIGKSNWPFPIPIVQKNGRWILDTDRGKENLLDRYIGYNELSAIAVLERIYLAQKAYYDFDLDHDGQKNFAAKIISSPGKLDGLYWPVDTEAGKDLAPSPLSELYALVVEEGYKVRTSDSDQNTKPEPYRGYYFKLLFNPDTPNKFVAIATPAVWNNSGIMSFAVDEKGWVYEKDFGSEGLIQNLEKINIDQSWARIQ